MDWRSAPSAAARCDPSITANSFDWVCVRKNQKLGVMIHSLVKILSYNQDYCPLFYSARGGVSPLMKPWPGRNVTPQRSRDELELVPLELCLVVRASPTLPY